jgi:hypothetical protein
MSDIERKVHNCMCLPLTTRGESDTSPSLLFDLICRCFGCEADVESEISVMVADWGTCDKQARRDKIVTDCLTCMTWASNAPITG